MKLRITQDNGVPIYMQVVNQIKYLVASGSLLADEELPPIRTLAEQLLVNPNTIARAYRELENAGLVTKRRTAGTFVSGGGSLLAETEQRRILTERVDTLLAEARHMSVSVDEIITLVKQRDSYMKERPALNLQGEQK